MKTKRYTQIIGAAFLCAALTLLTVAQADITIKIDGTDTQWTLTETELQQAPTLQAYIEDPTKVASSTTEIVLPNNEHTQELTLVMPYLQLASQLRNGTRPESDPIAAALEFAVSMKPGNKLGTFQEKKVGELLALADDAHYWGTTQIGDIVVEQVCKRLCTSEYVAHHLTELTNVPFTPDTKRSILKKVQQYSPAFTYWLIQDQILNNPVHDGQVLCTTFKHAGSVNQVLFNHDSTQFLTTSNDKTAKLWDTKTGNLLRTFNHKSWVTTAVFDHGATRILTASGDHTAILWDAETGEALHTLKHTGYVMSAAFNHDCSHIVTTSQDGTATLWDATSGQCMRTFKHTKLVRSVSFNHDSSRILTASADHTAKLWNTKTGELIHTFKHTNLIMSAVFDHDETKILTASWDKTAQLWDARTGKRIRTFRHGDTVNSAAFNRDETKILTASGDGMAYLWNAKTGELIHRFSHQEGAVSAVFNHDTSKILTISCDRNVKLWNTEKGKLIHTFTHQDAIRSITFNHDGTQILLSSYDKTARLWTIADPGLQKYVLERMSLEQAALLVHAYDCVRKNAVLSLRPDAQKIFEKLDPRLQTAVRSKCTVHYIQNTSEISTSSCAK